MERRLREQVWIRARERCEYCQIPQAYCDALHEVDHIIAEKHRGPTVLDNLALACYDCNIFKGPNIAGVDPDSQEIIRLYNPRSDNWSQHFVWNGAILVGLTSIGRTTIDVLAINNPERIGNRRGLINEGVFPPA